MKHRQLCAVAIAAANQVFDDAPGVTFTVQRDAERESLTCVDNVHHLLTLVDSATANGQPWRCNINPDTGASCEVYASTTVAGTAYCTTCGGYAYQREANSWAVRQARGWA